MNIYFSCSITGGRNDQPAYQAIVEHLQSKGHVVLTADLARPDVLSLEAVEYPRSVYERDVEWVTNCDALIAEVSTPSHGVGYEIALGLLLDKPVLCCYQTGKTVSKMLTGNSHPNFSLNEYDAINDLLLSMDRFLEKVIKH